MDLMRRIIANCLIVSLLFGGVAWAADMHAEAFFGHGASWSRQGGDQPAAHDGVKICDHCCHGSAHHVAFPVEPPMTVCARGTLTASSAARRHASLILEPPTQPPRA